MPKWIQVADEELETFEVTCQSEYGIDYHGDCRTCYYRRGERGDHWTTDKVWCDAPVNLEKGQTIKVVELDGVLQKYMIYKKRGK